jgi:hypothetical protein
MRTLEINRLYNISKDHLEKNDIEKAFNVATTAWSIAKSNINELFFTLSLYTCEIGYSINQYRRSYDISKVCMRHIDKCDESLKNKLEEIHKLLDNENLKMRATHNYEILKVYTIEEIFNIIGSKDTFTYKSHKYFKDGEYNVKLRRASVYKNIGVDCVCCETKATHFALGLDKGNNIHLDLYGYNKDGILTMITIDHIHPRCKGGPDKLDNYQPMCKICNEKKGGDLEN